MVKILVLQCRGEERKSTLESGSKVCEGLDYWYMTYERNRKKMIIR